MARYDFGVFVGRFQPLHVGHEHVVRQALLQTKHLIVLIGSANVARDTRNPFTYAERSAMFASVFPREVADGRIILKPLNDHMYSDTAWCAEVQATVKSTILHVGNGGGFQNLGLRDFQVCLTGYGKDASSYYLKLFPEWESVQIGSQYGTFSSTDVRNKMFQRIPEVPVSILPPGIHAQLDSFTLSDHFRYLLEEREYLDDYRQKWGLGPFLTADAVVVQSGHVLLVERGEMPGRGLLALPGGFVNPNERIRDAAIRELREETQIGDNKGELPPAMLASFIDDSRTKLFDAPRRSLRGRIVTQAHLFRLPERRQLFKVRGGDDAAKAKWYRIGELSPEMFFEDHWFILQQMADL